MDKKRVILIDILIIIGVFALIYFNVFSPFPKKIHQWGDVNIFLSQDNNFDKDAPKYTQVNIYIQSVKTVQRWDTVALPSEYSITQSGNEIMVKLIKIQEGGYSRFMDIDQGTSKKEAEVPVPLPKLSKTPLYVNIDREGDNGQARYEVKLVDNNIEIKTVNKADFILNTLPTSEPLIPQNLVRLRWKWLNDIKEPRDTETEFKIGDTIFGKNNWTHGNVIGDTLSGEPGNKEDWDGLFTNIYCYSEESLKNIYKLIETEFPDHAKNIALYKYNINGASEQYP